jgi:hypothetical protein
VNVESVKLYLSYDEYYIQAKDDVNTKIINMKTVTNYRQYGFGITLTLYREQIEISFARRYSL